MSKVQLIHYKIQELVPPETYNKLGDKAIEFFTNEILRSIEHVYEYFEHRYYGHKIVVIINNWSFDGKYKYRGYRPPECKEGAPHSEHRKGNAVDLDVYIDGKRLDPESVRQLIRHHRDQFPCITRMEANVNWVHIDCKEPNEKEIDLFEV
jgi:hypothetical protein